MEPRADRAEHTLFEIGVFFKGVHGLFELLGASVIYIVSGTTITNIASSLLTTELSEDPNDFLANLLLRHAHVTTAGKDFIALYLFVSAIVNIVMSAGLLLHRKRMFPLAMSILSAFVLYQAYLFTRTFSPWLVFLCLYDATMIWLIYMEFKRRWGVSSQLPAA